MDEGDALVPLMRPVLPPPAALHARLGAMHRSGWFSNFGPQSRELERRIGARLGVPADRVVAVANATLGLTGALATGGQHRWTLPSWTFSATVAAALQAGRDTVLRDVDERDWWLRCDGGEAGGVVRVAPFGVGFGAEAWVSAPEVVVDAAASLGADHRLHDMPAAAAVVYSLGATKVLGAGEGGVVVLGDAERAARFRTWTNLGFAEERCSRVVGLNAKLSEPAAVIALAALDGWDEERDEWLAARAVTDALTREHGLQAAPGLTGHVSPYWVVRLPDRRCREVVERVLTRHRVATRRWWGGGCHRMPAYRAIPRDPLPVTECLADTVLGLPMFRGLSQADAERIDDALREARAAADGW